MDKNFIKSIFATKKQFENGGSVLNLDFKLADLIAELQTMQANAKGYVRFTVAEKRPEKQEAGKPTHYVYENTWHGGGQPQAQHASVSAAATAEPQISVDSVPF